MKYYTSLDLSEHLDKSELKQDTYYYELTLNKKHELKSLNKIFNNETSNASEAEFENVSNYVKTLSQADWTYLEQLEAIIKNGVETENRTDTDTISIFGTQNRYDLSKSFPLLTTKKTVLRNIITELIWFIQGDTNLKYLKDVNNPIWNQWRRPYNLNRDLVKVRTRKENEYVNCIYEKGYLIEVINKYAERLYNNELDVKLYKLWANLMAKAYLGTGDYSISKEWQDYDTFIREVKSLPHWYYKTEDWDNFVLSNAYYSSSAFSKDTSVWLRKDEEELYLENNMVIKVTHYNGEVELYFNKEALDKHLGLDLEELLQKEYEELTPREKNIYDEFELSQIKEYEPSDGFVYRNKLIKDDDMGPIYGFNWRQFDYVDQLSNVIQEIKTNPNSRRLIISAWNPKEIDNMALPPCHTMFQFKVTNGKLDCQLYQRSADFPIGVPFNIASYALLVYLIAKECDLTPGEFIHTTGDTHIYVNQLEAVKQQLTRLPYPAPTLTIKDWNGIFNFTSNQIELNNYKSHKFLKMPVAK